MGKKSALIITMHKVYNYGSALQAWALQETIRKIGFDCTLIDYLYPNQYYFSHASKVVISQIPFYKRLRISKLVNYVKRRYLYRHEEQKLLFQTFWNKHFLLTEEYKAPEELLNNPPKADCYITGSDQVWNPNTMYGDPSFFLNFGNTNVSRIAYAASFGTNEIPSEYQYRYREFLLKYNHIGVREKSGQSLVFALSDKESSLVCDPTLLLTQEDYEALAKESTIKIDKPYLLAYILDYAYNPRPAIDSIIQQVAKKLGLHVVYLLCGNQNGFKWGTTTVSAAGPNEFVSLFRNASFVVTSSFHGTVFSLLHEKSFYAVLPAENKDSRISSLLTDLGLSERGIRANQSFSLSKESNLAVDYQVVNSRISRLRNRSLEFLFESMKGC